MEHRQQVPLPILDIRSFYSNDRSQFVQDLRSACHTVGFFLLRHDLPHGLAQQQLQQTKCFFHQSLEEKMKISYEDNPSFRGYMKLGVENTGGQVDWREQVEWAVEDTTTRRRSLDTDESGPAVSSTTTTTNSGDEKGQQQQKSYPYYERLRARENPWPRSSPALRETTLTYVHHVCLIAECLRSALCLAIGLEADYLTPLFYPRDDEPHWVIKLVCYPPIDNDNSRDFDGGLGVGAHTDTNFLTLVLQDDVVGLQVFSQGEWIDVPANTDSDQYLVVNLGEQAELFSRGYFLATPHRVLANSHSIDRVSVPLFYNPALTSTIRPLDCIPETVPWERPRDYEQETHFRMKSNRMLLSVGENTFKSLARSHPRVFARHHPDLTLLPDGQMEFHANNNHNGKIT